MAEKDPVADKIASLKSLADGMAKEISRRQASGLDIIAENAMAKSYADQIDALSKSVKSNSKPATTPSV